MNIAVQPERLRDDTQTVMFLSAEYLLRGMDILTQLHGDDLMKSLVFLAIWTANLRHLNGVAGMDARSPEDIPDTLRQPVSVLAISNSLRIPYETVRRGVNGLIAEGFCVRAARGGVFVPQAAQAKQSSSQAMNRVYRLTQRLMTDLKRAGIEATDASVVHQSV